MRSDIRKILTIVLENQTNAFSDLLGDGSQLGVRIQYKVQIIQRGIDDYSLMVEGKDKYIDELTSRIDDNNSVIDKINREIRLVSDRLIISEDKIKQQRNQIDEKDSTMEGECG